MIRWLARQGPLPASVRLEVDLRPATDVRGVVRDARGAPLPRVRLWASARDAPADGLLGAEADTDDQGRFVLELLAIGQEYELVARDLVGAHVETRTTFVPPGPDLDVRLADPGSIRVTLLHAEGAEPERPMGRDLGEVVSFVARRADPGAPGGWTPSVQAQLARWDDRRPRQAARERERLIVGLAPGTYRLHASSSSGSSGWASGDLVVRIGEETAASIQLVAGKPVRGRLVDPAGSPLPGVELEVRYDLPELATWCEFGPFATDGGGRFSIGRQIPEVQEVTVRRDGFEPRRVKLGETGDLGDVALTPSPR